MPAHSPAAGRNLFRIWLSAAGLHLCACTQIPTVIVDLPGAPSGTQLLDVNVWAVSSDRSQDRAATSNYLVNYSPKENQAENPFNFGLLLPDNDSQRYLVSIGAFAGSSDSERCLLSTTAAVIGPFRDTTINNHITFTFLTPPLAQGNSALCYSSTAADPVGPPTPLISGIELSSRHQSGANILQQTIDNRLVVTGWNFQTKSALTITPDIGTAGGYTVVGPYEIDVNLDRTKVGASVNQIVTIEVANPDSPRRAIFATRLSL